MNKERAVVTDNHKVCERATGLEKPIGPERAIRPEKPKVGERESALDK